MDTISASDAKIRFRALLNRVQTGPVIISKHGRPVAVMMSATEFDERLHSRQIGEPVELRPPLGELSGKEPLGLPQTEAGAHVVEQISRQD